MKLEESILEQLFGIKASAVMGGQSDIEFENEEHGDLMLKFENNKADLYISNGSSGYVLESSKPLNEVQKQELLIIGYKI